MVSMEHQDDPLETLEQLPHEQTIIDLQTKGEELEREVNRLKGELKKEEKAKVVAVNKVNGNLDLVRKIKGYIKFPADVLNKARLFYESLAKNLVTAAKVIPVLVDFN